MDIYGLRASHETWSYEFRICLATRFNEWLHLQFHLLTPSISHPTKLFTLNFSILRVSRSPKGWERSQMTSTPLFGMLTPRFFFTRRIRHSRDNGRRRTSFVNAPMFIMDKSLPCIHISMCII